MESLLGKYLDTLLPAYQIEYITQATKAKLKEQWNIDITLDKSDRRFDFAVRNIMTRKMVLIETNYYSGGGSKLKSTAGEYKSLHDFLKKQNLTLVWITDGMGWHTTERALQETFLYNDYVFNLHLMQAGALLEILLN